MENPISPLPETRAISLWLDDYDDIFSDFDPRPYHERSLSDDFLNEARKVFREKRTGQFELRILIPAGERNSRTEEVVSRRLRSYFKNTERAERGKISRSLRTGIALTLGGFLMMTWTLLLNRLEAGSFLADILLVVFEPAGWFAVWFGLDRLFYTVPEERKAHLFFKKISTAEIIFESY